MTVLSPAGASHRMGPTGSGRGDPRPVALRSLYEGYSRPVRAYATRLTGDRGIAEDVVQETFLRAWGHLHRLDPERSPLPWLLVVARNVSYGLGRRRAARPAESPLGDSGAFERVGNDADRVDPLLDEVIVAEALGRLGREHREVLTATYLRGERVADVAVRLGIPPGTVKSRAYYGLRALRLLLEEMGYRR